MDGSRFGEGEMPHLTLAELLRMPDGRELFIAQTLDSDKKAGYAGNLTEQQLMLLHGAEFDHAKGDISREQYKKIVEGIHNK